MSIKSRDNNPESLERITITIGNHFMWDPSHNQILQSNPSNLCSESELKVALLELDTTQEKRGKSRSWTWRCWSRVSRSRRGCRRCCRAGTPWRRPRSARAARGTLPNTCGGVQGDHDSQILGFVDFASVVHCLPNSAWIGDNWAERAEQLVKLNEK